jgi:phosphoserine phosphatase
MAHAIELAQGLTVQGVSPPLRWENFRLAAFDMDSTLITIECIDELAAVAGRKAEVVAITEAAMRGEITDYKDSLRRRVALLAGLPAAALEQVYAHQLALNPGVERFVGACRRAGLRTLLVSGGFTYFSRRVGQRLGLDVTHANELELVDGRLTGRMVPQPWGDICDGDEKRRMVEQQCRELGTTPAQAVVVGDGANDLPMMRIAGLSIAFHAKPAVRAQANVAITEGGLDRALQLFEPAH